MKSNNNDENQPPISPKLVSAYMAFIGRKGGAASARTPRLHFTTEHQQRAAAARWSQHNQQKQQSLRNGVRIEIINESKKSKSTKDRSN